VPGIAQYHLTRDGKKALTFSPPETWSIVELPAAPGGTGAPAAALVQPAGAKGKLKVEAIEVRVDPRAEWKQIFNEAWRINRDYFYDPGMHGADWKAMKRKYEAFLPEVTSSGDLYRVMQWMMSELAVGHSYSGPAARASARKP